MLCVGGWLVDVCVLMLLIGYGECVVLCLLEKDV